MTNEKSAIQKLLRFLPRPWQFSAERESLDWVMTCQHCAAETSVWDMGGIRWGASGTKRVLCKCPSCGSTGWNKLRKKADAAG